MKEMDVAQRRWEVEQNNETKLAVAQIAAAAKQMADSMKLFYEERARVGSEEHEATMSQQQLGHEALMSEADRRATEQERAHDVGTASMEHQHALEQQRIAVDAHLDLYFALVIIELHPGRILRPRPYCGTYSARLIDHLKLPSADNLVLHRLHGNSPLTRC